VGHHYERFCARLKSAVTDLEVGSSANPASLVGPVIDEESRSRLLRIIAQGESESNLLYKGEVDNSGYFVPITIFKDVKNTSFLWQEELFGPILAIAPANSFYEAIIEASNSQYALTGGLYSRHPDHIEYAKQHFQVGNLYINQAITGAIVARQPFGGFRLSGCGAKAGGSNYLLQFLNERTITENTIRKGYAPEIL
jgi:RHH-type proline utilization regulon transcriptional repressor/proline dehydrogenase/delta 1-pyrroline-5-carboxylate dehydrogenase